MDYMYAVRCGDSPHFFPGLLRTLLAPLASYFLLRCLLRSLLANPAILNVEPQRLYIIFLKSGEDSSHRSGIKMRHVTSESPRCPPGQFG